MRVVANEIRLLQRKIKALAVLISKSLTLKQFPITLSLIHIPSHPVLRFLTVICVLRERERISINLTKISIIYLSIITL